MQDITAFDVEHLFVVPPSFSSAMDPAPRVNGVAIDSFAATCEILRGMCREDARPNKENYERLRYPNYQRLVGGEATQCWRSRGACCDLDCWRVWAAIANGIELLGVQRRFRLLGDVGKLLSVGPDVGHIIAQIARQHDPDWHYGLIENTTSFPRAPPAQVKNF